MHHESLLADSNCAVSEKEVDFQEGCMNNSVVAPVERHTMRMLRCEVSVDALCYRDRLIQYRVLIVDGAKGTTSHEDDVKGCSNI